MAVKLLQRNMGAVGDEPSDRGCGVLPEADAAEPVIRPHEWEEIGDVSRSSDGDRATLP